MTSFDTFKKVFVSKRGQFSLMFTLFFMHVIQNYTFVRSKVPSGVWDSPWEGGAAQCWGWWVEEERRLELQPDRLRGCSRDSHRRWDRRQWRGRLLQSCRPGRYPRVGGWRANLGGQSHTSVLWWAWDVFIFLFFLVLLLTLVFLCFLNEIQFSRWHSCLSLQVLWLFHGARRRRMRENPMKDLVNSTSCCRLKLELRK